MYNYLKRIFVLCSSHSLTFSCPVALDIHQFLFSPFFFLAIKNEQYDTASLLLHYDAKVDQRGSLQRTALHEAALLGLDNYVYLLLQSGADPNVCDASERTPLGLAAQAGHLSIVEILLQGGTLSA